MKKLKEEYLAEEAQSRYLIAIKTKNSGTLHVLATYNKHQDLVTVELRNISLKMTEAQSHWIWAWIPKTVELLEAKRNKDVSVTKLETDLSFTAFWDLYDYKVGNKIRAKAHWEKLSDNKRALVLKKVKEYNFYMKHKSHDKVFAERFLSQKRYENEFNLAH